MFQIKSEEIEVTAAMIEGGVEALARYDHGDLWEWKVCAIYRAMERARRDAQIGIVWGEPPIEPPKG